MRVRFATLLTALAAAALISSAGAQSKPKAKPAPGERGLIGIRLFDSGVRVLNLFGSPDEIQAISVNGAVGGSGGGGGGGGAVGAPGPAGGGAPTAGPGTAGAGFINSGLIGDPFGVGDPGYTVRQMQPSVGGTAAGQPPSNDRGAPQFAPGGGTGDVGGQTPGVTAQFVRWVYRRSASRYGFIIDKSNRVVQIEAVGVYDGRVSTSKAVRFGSSFAQVVRKYGTPDAGGYEIAGDSFLLRFLNRQKVAFRFSRLSAGKPHQVTGIVVAAGKP